MKFYIENFGCQMNEQDVAKMAFLLRKAGHEPIKDIREAEVVLVNTCCVREKAEQKFFSLMGRLKTMKKRRGIILGVAGCLAQQEKDTISERLPFVDFALGPSSVHCVAEAIEQAGRGRSFADFSENGCTPSLLVRPGSRPGEIKTYVTIMKGCNNFCSYCVVPYVRGREVSRDSNDVLEEIESLASEGIREVILLGQNVNSYNKGGHGLSFPQLLERVNGVEGIERIRFVTSHPKDLSPELIGCFGRLEKLCEQIHLPFQAGSDKILKLMSRGYTGAEYRAKIGLLRNQCPQIAVTADCIVGFPQEDETDFEETVKLVRDLEFDGMFSFVYSPRKRTSASALPGEIPREKALERLSFLQGLQKSVTIKKNRQLEGAFVQVLVEGPSKSSDRDLAGRTRTNKIVNFEGPAEMAGRLVDVKITHGYANSLRGEL
jgi:tRNA-2-methylthio-N6-dimethylallyladenosine synthase